MKTKKLLSFALVLAMLVGMLPGMSLTASAAGNTTEITPTNTSGTMTITLTIKAAQTITVSDVTATYGDTDKSITASVTNPATGGGTISYAVKDGSGDYINVASDGKLTIKKVPPTDGKAYVIVKAAATDDYAETTKEVAVTISKAEATVTAKNQSIMVGGTVPDLSSPVLDTHYSVTGLVGTDTLTTAPTLAYQKDGSAATPVNTAVGTYDIVPSGASAGDNYNISYTKGTLTISDKAAQTITAADVTATYGDTGKSVNATTSGNGAISYAVKSGSGDYIDVAADGKLTIKKVPADGKAYVIVTAAGTDDYAETTKEVTVTISKATVTIKAKDQSIYVGGTVPTLGSDSYTVTGLVDSDTLATNPTLAYSSTPDNTKAGTYTITPSGAAAGDNYEISYQNGTLTISARPAPSTPSTPSSSDSSDRDTTPSTPSTPSTTTETKTSETATAADGAAVTTELDASTTTKTNSDGSVTVTDKATETVKTENADGSAVETKTEKTNAETTGSKKNADGSVTDTTKVQNTETVKETATDANGSQTVTETKTEQEQNTAVTTKDNADGSKSEKTETTETVKVTEKVTDGSGKVTETVTTTKTETVTDITAAQDGTATGTSTTTTTVTDDKGNVLSTTVTEAEIKASTDANGMVTTKTAATTTTTDAQGNETVEKTVTTENKAPDGSTGTVVKDESGSIVSQSTTISQKEAEAARDEGRPAQSPLTVTPVPEAVENSARSVQVNMPAVLYDKDGDGIVTVAEMPKVEIQVTYSGPGVVAKEKDANGNLTRIAECYEGSVIVPVTGTGEIVIVDNTKTFADVAGSDWYSEYVTFVTAREIFNGTGGGQFSPDATMTRAMLAQVLYNFARGAKAGDGTAFADVSAGDWFNAAIGWAYENGVVTGYGGTFGAQNNITRQDMATILYRYAKQAGYDVSKTASLDKFSDAGDVADYAAEAMRWAVGMGLIEGSDGKLNPTGNATRAQVAAIMTRFVRNAK